MIISSLVKICISPVHIIFMSFLAQVKIKSTTWPAPNVWVFMAQLVESAAALIDCEQSLSFSSDLVRDVHARASVERRNRETQESKAAAPVSRLQSRAWSFACLGRFARRTKEKERLLI